MGEGGRLQDRKEPTESEKADNLSKTKDFITGNRKKRALVLCLGQVQDKYKYNNK